MVEKIPMTCTECGAKRRVHPQWLANVFIAHDKPYKCFDCMVKENAHITSIDVHI